MAGIGLVSALGPGSGSAAVMGGGPAPVATWWDLDGAILTCVAAYQPKGAASLAASYVNLANPGTYDAVVGVAPAWAAGTGWTFNGATQYLTSAIPYVSNWSFLMAYSAPASAVFMGIVGSPGNYMISPNETGAGGRVYYYNGNFNRPAPGLPAGVVGWADRACYRDGVPDGNAPAYGPTAATSTFGMGVRMAGGAPNTYIPITLKAIAWWSSALTAPQMLALAIRMAAL